MQKDNNSLTPEEIAIGLELSAGYVIPVSKADNAADFIRKQAAKIAELEAALARTEAHWKQELEAYKQSPPPNDDRERLDFLQRWVWRAKARGFVWDTFTFQTNRAVREQLDEQMKIGMREIEKSVPQPVASSEFGPVMLQECSTCTPTETGARKQK